MDSMTGSYNNYDLSARDFQAAADDSNLVQAIAQQQQLNMSLNLSGGHSNQADLAADARVRHRLLLTQLLQEQQQQNQQLQLLNGLGLGNVLGNNQFGGGGGNNGGGYLSSLGGNGFNNNNNNNNNLNMSLQNQYLLQMNSQMNSGLPLFGLQQQVNNMMFPTDQQLQLAAAATRLGLADQISNGSSSLSANLFRHDGAEEALLEHQLALKRSAAAFARDIADEGVLEQQLAAKRYKMDNQANPLLMLAEASSETDDDSTDFDGRARRTSSTPSRRPNKHYGYGNNAPGVMSWENYYRQLKTFRTRYGHCNVPGGWDENRDLASWVDTQRQEGLKRLKGNPAMSKLSDRQMEKLDRLGFLWPTGDAWEDMFAQLESFHRQHSHANVPHRYKENPKLARWIDRQREHYKAVQDGKDSPLTQERIAKLNKLRLDWRLKTSSHETWDGMYEKLLDFRDEHGHCIVPDKSKDDPKLGRWVRMQRRHYKLLNEGGYSSLTDDRIKKLDDINFQWSVKESWDDMYHKLLGFRDQYGHCNVPQKWKVDPKLGVWVHHQRRFFKLKNEGKYSTLSQERIDKLNEIQFCWDSPEKHPHLFHIQVPKLAVSGEL